MPVGILTALHLEEHIIPPIVSAVEDHLTALLDEDRGARLVDLGQGVADDHRQSHHGQGHGDEEAFPERHEPQVVLE